MVMPILEDISQLAKLRVIFTEMESLAIKVYMSGLIGDKKNQRGVVMFQHREVMDQIAGTLARAYTEIAGHGGLRTISRTPAGIDHCGPGFCPDGPVCVPCYENNTQQYVLFPIVDPGPGVAPTKTADTVA